MLQGIEIKRLFDAEIVARITHDLRISFEDVSLFGRRWMKVHYHSEKIEAGDNTVPEYAVMIYRRLERDELPATGEWRWPIPKGTKEIEEWREFIESAETFLGLIRETHLENAMSIADADLYTDKGKITLREFLIEASKIAEQMSKTEKKRIAAALGEIPSIARATEHAIIALSRLINDGNIHDYTKMCCGTLPKSKMTEELAKTKILTEKILKYTPEIATFADKVQDAQETIAKMNPIAHKEFERYIGQFAGFRKHGFQTRAESYFWNITNSIRIYL